MRRFFKQHMVGFGIALIAAEFGTLAGAEAYAANLKGYAWQCADKKEICFWHKAVVAPPKGWSEEESWTQRYKAMVLFPNGDKSRSKPIMYVRAHSGDKEQTIDSYVSVAQERWKQRSADSTIEPLADFERAGKPAFKVYLYKNPSQPDQAFELTAFLKDTDAAHPEQTYFFQVVLSSPTMAKLDKAKAAFYDVLGRI